MMQQVSKLWLGGLSILMQCKIPLEEVNTKNRLKQLGDYSRKSALGVN